MATKERPRAPGQAAKVKARVKVKVADLPDLMPHTVVAEKFGVTATTLRNWVASGEFPQPHSVMVQTWLYKVDTIRAYLETGRWPEGTTFRRDREEG